MASSRNLRVADAAESKAMLLRVLDGGDGITRARAAIDDGSARAKLDQFVSATRSL
jgi:anthranilate phosphoribosyltransferase